MSDEPSFPISVLIVDDHAPFRSAARALVERAGGFTVVADAATGEAALVAVDEHRPDVVVLDVRLPGRDGIEVCREVTARHPETMVVLVSTYPPDDLPEGLDSAGAAAFVPKEDLTGERLRELWRSRWP